MLFCLFQLYEINDDPKRKEFLDDLFSFMQKRGKSIQFVVHRQYVYRGDDKSLTLPTSRCVLFVGENISFDASLVVYINSTNIYPIMIINRIYETQNLLSL